MQVENTVKKILADVKRQGDRALINYTAKFDHIRLTASMLKIAPRELEKSWQKTPEKIKKALKQAQRNIVRFHSRQRPRAWKIEPAKGVQLRQLFQPLEKVGVYVPGGSAPLVSSVLMTVIPARIAGVPDIILTTPPPVNQYILSAAWLAGVNSVFQIGGAQAIGALAYGTKTVPRVNKIVGPGNIFVTTAKKLVFGDVAIDMPAGPSEILIIADKTADPSFIALDLLSQAEHDPLSQATLLTTASVKSVAVELKERLRHLGRKHIISTNRIKLIKVPSINKAVVLSNQIAPEHLELMVRNPERLVPKIKNAGIILIGPYTPVAVSDFLAGTNHVLPAGGAARSFSALTVWDFLKPVSTVKYTKKAIEKIKPFITTFAEIEGLDAHAQSAQVR